MGSRSPLDEALDLMVFGPLGLALTAIDEMPRMVEKGRQRVMLAKMIGEHATRHGQRVATKTLVSWGILPGPPRPPGGVGTPAPPTIRAREPAPMPPDYGRVDQPAGAGSSAPVSADLAIPGYDSLAASHVVQRLAGLAPDELEAVRTYEAAGRGRRTILNKIAQLQSG